MTLVQANQRRGAHHAEHPAAEQHRIEQHSTAEQLRVTGQHQPGQHAAEAVAHGKAGHFAVFATARFKRFHGQRRRAVPTQKRPAMVTVTVPLHIT